MTPLTVSPADDEPAISNPIFAMAARADTLRRNGIDVITLAAGEAAAATSAAVVGAAVAAARDPRTHRYAAAAGELDLRAEVARSIAARHAIELSPNSIQISMGAKHAIHLALHAVTRPGDDVLVLAPGWPGHRESAAAVGATAVPVPTDTDFRVDPTLLAAAVTPRTRALILANPANPTGAVHDHTELAAIADWCVDNNIWLISDEVYDNLIYTDSYAPVLAAAPRARARTIVVGGVSKVHAMTGWRVGWLAGPPDVVDAAREHVARTITHVPAMTQHAALAAVQDHHTPARAARTYRAGRDLLVAGLNSVRGIECPVPEGGMFAFPDVSGLLDRGPWSNSTELALWLLDHAHVAAVGGEAFGGPARLRLNFAVGHDCLRTAVHRIARSLADIEDAS